MRIDGTGIGVYVGRKVGVLRYLGWVFCGPDSVLHVYECDK